MTMIQMAAMILESDVELITFQKKFFCGRERETISYFRPLKSVVEKFVGFSLTVFKNFAALLFLPPSWGSVTLPPLGSG